MCLLYTRAILRGLPFLNVCAIVVYVYVTVQTGISGNMGLPWEKSGCKFPQSNPRFPSGNSGSWFSLAQSWIAQDCCFLRSKRFERIYLKCCWPFDQTLTMGGFLDYSGQSFWEFCSQDIKLFMVLIIYICFLQDKMLLTCCILSPQKCLCAPVCVCIVCVCVCTRVWSWIILNRDHNLLRYSSGQIRIPTMPRTIGQGQSPRFALWHIYIYI